MTVKKEIQLTSLPLDTLIKNGESIDFRLDEPVWKNLEQGDVIEFWEDLSGWDKAPSTNSRKVKAKIVEVFRASSFSELIDNLPTSFSTDTPKEEILRDLRQWWTPEKEKQVGVLGWRVIKI